MGIKDLLTRQGRFLVVRDAETGRIKRNDDGTQQRALMPSRADSSSLSPQPKREKEQTWRRNLKRLTNDGQSLHERLLRIGMGEVLTAEGYTIDPDTGEKTRFRGEPQVAPLSVQHAVLKDLHEMLHGKSVPETEVSLAEKEAEKQQALEAMSDEQLRRIIDAPGNQTIDVQPAKKEGEE